MVENRHRAARRSFVTPQTMQEILNSLEQSGAIQRRQHVTHGRVLQAFLTESGRERLLAGHKAALDVNERMLQGLTPQQRTELAALLCHCTAQLEAIL